MQFIVEGEVIDFIKICAGGGCNFWVLNPLMASPGHTAYQALLMVGQSNDLVLLKTVPKTSVSQSLL